MRENDEFIGQVEDYLVGFDGKTPLPGRVMDAIHAELPRTRQAKAGPGFMRMPPMLSTISSRAPWGIAAAAVAVVLVLGATFIYRNNNQSPVGAAPASIAPPGATGSPGPSSAPRSELPMLTSYTYTSCPGITDEPECLEPGTYQLGTTVSWPAIVTMDVPAGWWSYVAGTDQQAVLVQTEDVAAGSGWGVAFSTIGSLSKDPCDPSAGTFEPDGHSLGEVFDVIDQWPGFEATEAVPIENGYSGLRFTLTSTKSTADCRISVMWTTANGSPLDTYPLVNEDGRPLPVDFQIFDIDGEPLVIAAMDFPDTSPHEEANGHPHDPNAHAADQTELNAIVDSIDIKSKDGGGS